MKRSLAVVLMLTLMVALASWPATQEAEAVLVVDFSVTSADTITFDKSVGFITITADVGDVGVRVLGSYFVADDSMTVFAEETVNIPLALVNHRARAIALYPAAGATGRGYAW